MYARRGFLLAAVLIASAGAAQAQSYPSRPIKLVVAVIAGGPMDVMGRLVAQQLSTTLGPVFVENRAGAGTTLGAKAVASAERACASSAHHRACLDGGPMLATWIFPASRRRSMRPSTCAAHNYSSMMVLSRPQLYNVSRDRLGSNCRRSPSCTSFDLEPLNLEELQSPVYMQPSSHLRISAQLAGYQLPAPVCVVQHMQI